MVERKFGWKPSLPDFRDYQYKVTRIADLPEKVDLRSKDSFIEDQGSLGSCTACAAVAALEHIEVRDKVKFVNLSKLFVYYNTRAIENSIRSDSGCTIRDTIKSIVTKGACAEKLWPYVVSKFRNKPTITCYQDGLKHKAKSYYRLTRLNDIKACLADGNVVIVGIVVYSGFMSARTEKTGMVRIPTSKETELGGHAVLIVGYIDKDDEINEIQGDKSGHFICKNSWGSDWGDGGYFYLPYDYLMSLGDDFWTIKK